MKITLKQEYVKFYNLAKEAIKDENLIPTRTNEEICKLVSSENWLMFLPKGEEVPEDSEKKRINISSSENPNVWFEIPGLETGDMSKAQLGFAFNNLKSYEKFKAIMHVYNSEVKSEVIKHLLTLENTWKLNVRRKVKIKCYQNTPTYKTEKEWKSNEITDNIIDSIVETSDMIRNEGIVTRNAKRLLEVKSERYYCETPAINLMEIQFELTDENFVKLSLECFKILPLCLSVANNKQIKTSSRKSIEIKKLKDLIQMYEKGFYDYDENIVNGLNESINKLEVSI